MVLSLAYYLQKSTSVSLFEKSQGVSGRMSTRSFADFEFDHGAQFFTARSNKFNEFLLPYLEDRTVVNGSQRFYLRRVKIPLSAYGTNHTTLLNQK